MYMLLFGILATAMAQEPQTDGVDIEFFRAPAADYGYLGVPSATTYQHLQFGVAAWFNYSNDPVTFTENGLRVVPSTITLEGDNGDGIIDNRVASQVQLGLGFTKHFSIAADVPLVLWQDGYRIDGSFSPIESPQPLIGAGVGDGVGAGVGAGDETFSVEPSPLPPQAVAKIKLKTINRLLRMFFII